MAKLKIKTAVIKLSGEFEGLEFTARTNPKLKTVRKLSSEDFTDVIEGLSEVILSWNFEDEDGNPLGAVSRDTIEELPLDLMLAMAGAINQEVSRLPGN